MLRHDNRLIARHGPEGFPVEVVEMGMRYQHKVDRREVMNFKARLAEAFDNLQPLRPVRVDENAVLGGLNEKRGVADPGDAKLANAQFGIDGLGFFSVAFGEHGGDDHLSEEVALVPSAAELHVHMQIRLLPCSHFFLDELADHVSRDCP